MLFPMPVIVSAHRSGTALLRLMLDAHPGLAIPPETGFLALCARSIHECAGASLGHEMSSDGLREFGANADEWLNELGYLQQGA
jgi:hypothetical protein